jgi:hypothetical protein
VPPKFAEINQGERLIGPDAKLNFHDNQFMI